MDPIIAEEVSPPPQGIAAEMSLMLRRSRDVWRLVPRILLKQPPILILDEATSALDNISEREVQRALGLTSADRTTILVAHRLSTLRDADRIFVFDEGRIVEVGSFTQLVAAGGVFTELFMSAESGTAPYPSPEPAADAAEPIPSVPETASKNETLCVPESELVPIPVGDMA